MKDKLLLTTACWMLIAFASQAQSGRSQPDNTGLAGRDFVLNGDWQYGLDRKYQGVTKVPGIPLDPTTMITERLWYKRMLTLPAGDWQNAVLELKGARFLPEVYINGVLVSKKAGGMAHTFHMLKHPAMKPGNKVTIEIALTALKNLPSSDASYIPPPDQWRSNVSSCLWDDVLLHVYKTGRIETVIPFIDFDSSKSTVNYQLDGPAQGTIKLEITAKDGRVMLSRQQPVGHAKGTINFSYKGILLPWSPDVPNLYKLRISWMNADGTRNDKQEMSFAVKKIAVQDKKFYLNNRPFTAAGGTVVWHRWVRTEEGRQLGYDTAWFYTNVVKRLKEHGANYLRFHLGVPPEQFLDMCDRYGLLVQYEWNFFHGMPAFGESLLEQYRAWLNIAVRHPSVSFVHPYNETEGDQLQTVWAALDQLLPNYPPMILEERDVIHVHKYWWSLFENLGLYYDDYSQFPKAVMIDEFGGNYLDSKGDLGAYVTVKESYLRFLGREHTAAQRLHHQAIANGKVAEYWRRIGAAGIAPFCILGSWNDGNNWFLGDLKDGKPKPVWDALTAAWSPQTVSVELWDRNFIPGQSVVLPIDFFNNVDKKADFRVSIYLTDSSGRRMNVQSINANMNEFTKRKEQVTITMPDSAGEYTVHAELIRPDAGLKYPVISSWEIHVFQKTVPLNLTALKVAISGDEPELAAFLNSLHIGTTALTDTSSRLILTSLNTWQKLQQDDKQLQQIFSRAITRGTSIVMLDIGDRRLGQGYPDKAGELGPLQGVAKITDPKINTYSLFDGIKVSFKEAAEPESHIHADKTNHQLYAHIPAQNTWIWNGLRAGLIIPASDMEFSGLNARAFLSQWKAYGADEDKIKAGPYYAYELQGFYEFSAQADNENIKKKLKEKIEFLVQDAPALAISINPNTAVKVMDLTRKYGESKNAIAENLMPLVNAGKNLTRTPVVMIDFGKNKGKLIASQLLTSGRLAAGFGTDGLYGIRYDEVAVQFVLNMMSLSVDKK